MCDRTFLLVVVAAALAVLGAGVLASRRRLATARPYLLWLHPVQMAGRVATGLGFLAIFVIIVLTSCGISVTPHLVVLVPALMLLGLVLLAVGGVLAGRERGRGTGS